MCFNIFSFRAPHKKAFNINEVLYFLFLFFFFFFFMNTQKIQTGTVGTKGFTLVELIVVITILVILGTIAFLNLGGMSASARDSQRTSDLNQINQQIMVQQAKSGLSYMTMVDGTGSSLTSGADIAGGTGITTGTTYNAGNVSYTVLGIDSAKFKDPTKATPYRMGATTLAGSAYQLAASLEESNTALVMGTYRARTVTNTASGTYASNVITLTSGLGIFKIGDTITDGTNDAKVTGVSADLARVTVDAVLTSSSVFALNAAESAGLIQSTTANTAVQNGLTYLPYSLQ